MIGKEQVFSTGKDNYGTPKWLFDWANENYGPFDIDLAASAENHKVDKYFTEEDDALKQSWHGYNAWLNPPYSKSLCKKFIAKAGKESLIPYNPKIITPQGTFAGLTRICMLLAARTSNQEWHKVIFPLAHELIFVKGRVIFEGETLGAPFPSVLVIFGNYERKVLKVRTLEQPRLLKTC